MRSARVMLLKAHWAYFNTRGQLSGYFEQKARKTLCMSVWRASMYPMGLWVIRRTQPVSDLESPVDGRNDASRERGAAARTQHNRKASQVEEDIFDQELSPQFFCATGFRLQPTVAREGAFTVEC